MDEKIKIDVFKVHLYLFSNISDVFRHFSLFIGWGHFLFKTL